MCTRTPGHIFGVTLKIKDVELISLRRTYPDSRQGEEIRVGFDPEQAPVDDRNANQSTGTELITEPDASTAALGEGDETGLWRQDGESARRNVSYGSMNEESDVWGGDEGRS